QYRSLLDSFVSVADRQSALAKELTPDYSQKQAMIREEAQEMAGRIRELSKAKAQYDVENALKQPLDAMANRMAAADVPMQRAATEHVAAKAAESAREAAHLLAKAAGPARASVGSAIDSLERLAPVYLDAAKLAHLAD